MHLRDLQRDLPWGAHSYSKAFLDYPAAHRDFAHALLHIGKASYRLADAVDAADHSEDVEACFKPEAIDKYLADVVICAVRMANTCPGRQVDLEMAVKARLAEKFPQDE